MSITVATFNIWFDKYYILERTSQIIFEIIETRPKLSVISLQEVTYYIYNILKQCLSNYYFFTEYTNNQQYDTIILIEKKFKINNIYKKSFTLTKMQRNFAFVCITDTNINKNYLISTAHLESEFKKNIDQPNIYKISQFEEAFNILEQYIKKSKFDYELVVFMGDTNISNQENDIFTQKIPNEWKDFYVEFGSPKHLEFTYDHTKNNNTYFPIKSRLDRIYYKKNQKSKMEPYTFSFLGQEPYRKYLYASDHFGIVANFSE
jgi:hypothetical protein